MNFLHVSAANVCTISDYLSFMVEFILGANGSYLFLQI